jgi:hypothetical protein
LRDVKFCHIIVDEAQMVECWPQVTERSNRIITPSFMEAVDAHHSVALQCSRKAQKQLLEFEPKLIAMHTAPVDD